MTDEDEVRKAWNAKFMISQTRGRVRCIFDGLEQWSTCNWAAAAEFTSQRLEEIRRVDEEIECLKMWRSMVEPKDIPWKAADRILAREQAALAELKRGLRTEETQ